MAELRRKSVLLTMQCSIIHKLTWLWLFCHLTCARNILYVLKMLFQLWLLHRCNVFWLCWWPSN